MFRRRRKLLMFAAAAVAVGTTTAVLVLLTQLLAATVFHSAYALGPPPPSIDVALHFDLDTAKGFENVTTLTAQDPSPVFVLMRGRTATMNITFTAVKEPFADIKENDTASILSIWYGGNAANNYKGGGGYTSLPDGITASIKPQNLTLPPGSKATVTLQISATPNTEIRRYDLDFSFRLKTPSYTHGTTPSYNTILTIVEGNDDAPSTTTTTTITSTATAKNQTQDLIQIGFQFYNQSSTTRVCTLANVALATPARPISLPVKFVMSTAPTEQGCYTTRTHYLGALLAANVPYLVNITSTAPVNLAFVQGTENNSSKLAFATTPSRRTVLNELQVTSFNQNITVDQTGLYVFIFDVDKPLPIATVDFSVRPANILVVTTTTTTVTTLSTRHELPLTTVTSTVSTTLTNTVTNTATEKVADPSTYAWAASATAAALVLVVVVLLLQRRTK